MYLFDGHMSFESFNIRALKKIYFKKTTKCYEHENIRLISAIKHTSVG